MATKTSRVLVTGNTFPVKDQLRSLGGKWDAAEKGWSVPPDKADEARALVSGAPQTAPSTYRPKTCCVCGIVQTLKRTRRGTFPNVKIYASGECQDCYEERKMGY